MTIKLILIISICVALVVLFFKRFFKLLIISLIALAIYVLYIYYQGGNVNQSLNKMKTKINKEINTTIK